MSSRQSYKAKILAVLKSAGNGGCARFSIAARITPQYGHSSRTHAAYIHGLLRDLEHDGLVRRIDDQKPIIWVKITQGKLL